MLTLIALISISQPIPDYVMESLSRYIEYRNPPVQSELERRLDSSAVDPCRIMLFNGCKVG